MAGNKALEKFKESKIPKKGKGKITKEISIYKEPNTQSEIIGRIKKNQEISWISKSICDEREWIRCNKNNDYGYIVGYEKDGKCNLDIGTIKEKTDDEVKKEYGFEQKSEIIPITKEEVDLGKEALKEILNDLNDEDDIKKDDDSESKTNKSTEMDESNKSNYSFSSGLDEDQNKNQTGIKIIEDDDNDDWEDFIETDLTKLDYIKSKNKKLINEIACQMNKKKSKGNNQKNSKSNTNSNNNYKSNITEKSSKREKEILSLLDDLKEMPGYDELKLELIFELVHIKSKEIIEYNLKHGTNIDTVEINGFKYPLDFSENFGTYEEVLEQVKRYYGIPANVQPVIDPSYNNQEKYDPESRILVFKWVENGVKKTFIIRNDFHGHEFENGYEIISHFNGIDDKKHFYYRGKREWSKKPQSKKKKK